MLNNDNRLINKINYYIYYILWYFKYKKIKKFTINSTNNIILLIRYYSCFIFNIFWEIYRNILYEFIFVILIVFLGDEAIISMSVAGEVTDTSIMEVGRSRPQFQYSRVWCTFTIRLYKIFSLPNTLFTINLLNRESKYICYDKLFILWPKHII